jgi:multidrug efflux system membrane fusion protein
MKHTEALRILACCAFAGALLGACSPEEAKGPASRPPVPVVVATAGSKTVPVQLRAVGNVKARRTVAVKSRVGGELARVLFREGDEIKAGDVLFTIDPRPFRTALEQAEAMLARNLAQQENAREEMRRYEGLVAQGFVSRQEYDKVRTEAVSFAGAVRADRAAVEEARLQLEYCTIRAPIAGRLGALLVNEGNLVKANDDNPLVVIHQIAPIDVVFSLSEKYLPQIRQALAAGALPLTAASPEGGETPVAGTVSFLDNAVDSSTGTIALKGSFANADRRLWPGEFVQVVLTLRELPQATVIPTRALQAGQQGSYIFVVTDDNGAEERPVATGIAYGEETVISQGLRPGETVVVEGQQRLAPGARVSIKEPAAQTAAGESPRS